MTLSPPQLRMLERLHNMAKVAPERPEILVSGRAYRTAEALERRGLASVRYQGPTMGWARVVHTYRVESKAGYRQDFTSADTLELAAARGFAIASGGFR